MARRRNLNARGQLRLEAQGECAGCGRGLFVPSSMNLQTKQEIIKYIKKYGWWKIRNRSWHCGNCVEQMTGKVSQVRIFPISHS